MFILVNYLTNLNKMRLTLIRHAQSLANAGLSTYRNPGLSDLGIIQSKQLLGTYDLIILSPLRRVLQTFSTSHLGSSSILI